MAPRFVALLAVCAALTASPVAAQAAQGGDPTCSLARVTEAGINQGDVADSLAGLNPITGPFKFYLAALNGPGGHQQLSYFQPTGTTWTALFLSEGPGLYIGTLLDVVDNQKGAAKERPLSTRCSATL